MKKGSFLLLLTALIWGMAFVAQSVAMDSIGPWTFTCVRSFVAGITLLVLIPFIDHTPKPKDRKDKAMHCFYNSRQSRVYHRSLCCPCACLFFVSW